MHASLSADLLCVARRACIRAGLCAQAKQGCISLVSAGSLLHRSSMRTAGGSR